MIRIDVFGSPGIGKSTLLNYAVQQDRKWLTKGEALGKAVSASPDLSWKIKAIAVIGLKIGIKRNALKSIITSHPHISNSNISRGVMNVVNGYRLSKFCSGRYDATRALEQADILRNRIRWIVFLGKNLNQPVLFDEGLAQACSTSVFADLTALEDGQVLVPDGVIHCTGNPQLVYERVIKRRRSGGHTAGNHEGLNDEELFDHINRSLEGRERQADSLVEMGVPVLTLNMADSLASNTERLQSFVETVAQQPK